MSATKSLIASLKAEQQEFIDEKLSEPVSKKDITTFLATAINGGKHKGKTYRDVFVKDQQYLKWMLRIENTFATDLERRVFATITQ